MNERIKELVNLAGGIGHDDDGNELTPVLVGAGLQRFAKLIILDCVRVGREEFLNDHSKCPVFPGNTIKSYFGIE